MIGNTLSIFSNMGNKDKKEKKKKASDLGNIKLSIRRTITTNFNDNTKRWDHSIWYPDYENGVPYYDSNGKHHYEKMYNVN